MRDPTDLLRGPVLLLIPHMDDCVLACGGTIASLESAEQVHLLYATDGMGSPAPVLPWRDRISPDLGEIRKREAREAMDSLGVPAENVRFLDLPDGRLHRHAAELARELSAAIDRLRPQHLFIPFRFDRHADHLAVNRAVTRASLDGRIEGAIFEYFVYYRWRLLPRGDVRAYIDPRHLWAVPIEPVRGRKRRALELFRSQTTRFYPWQTRPNLTPALLDEVCGRPELFLRYDPAYPGAAIFRRLSPWIRAVHRLEPFLKVHKDRAVAVARRAVGSRD